MTQFYFCKIAFIVILLYGCTKSNKKEASAVVIDTIKTNASESKADTSHIIVKNQIKNQPNSISIDSNDCIYETAMKRQGLVNIKEIDPSILVNLKYSTQDNFVGKDVYGCLSDCYLQKKAAEMLIKASKFLQAENDSLRLLVYDGARPHAIQKILWDALPQYTPAKRKTFVSDPAIGSIHNYGSAVDLTIADVNGNPLDMGTKYDYFGELAYPRLEKHFLETGKLSQNQVNNRILLRKVMQKAGFMPIEYEWWHFNAISRAKAKVLYSIVK